MKNHTLSFLGVLIVVLMALAMPASATGEENILRVGPDQEYETIQVAVDAAKQGSKILVYPSYYEENVLITKNNLQIIAQGEDVIVASIDPFPAPGCFHVLADHVTIRGFEIRYGEGCAPAIEFQGSHNTFAENNIYLDATCLGANAIVCRDGDGGSDYNTIEHNYIDQADLGIVISALGKNSEYTPGAINTGNVIQNNSTRSIGALAIGVENGKDFLVAGNSIECVGDGICVAIGTHGEDASAQGHHTIMNNTMRNCAGNGISLYAYPGTVLTHNRISDNTIQYCGSDCIALEASEGAVLTDNQVTGNEVSFSKLCGILLGAFEGAPDVSVSDTTQLTGLSYWEKATD
jgi:parallel beta-helix repeat protein